MEALLKLNAVPGVLGSMACDARGQVLAHAFPPTYDERRLQEVAAALAERSAALEAAVGPVRTIDMRFANARVVARTVDGVRLLFLCSSAVNLQTLVMSATGAARTMERLIPGPPADAAPPPGPAAPAGGGGGGGGGGKLYQLVQRIDQLIIRGGLDRFKVRGQIAFKSGFALDLVEPETPDDPAKLQKLRAVASELLGQPL
jgi:predicted regulator of Ras-like GTPase activity (Roadblock/LC7/MglB family)